MLGSLCENNSINTRTRTPEFLGDLVYRFIPEKVKIDPLTCFRTQFSIYIWKHRRLRMFLIMILHRVSNCLGTPIETFCNLTVSLRRARSRLCQASSPCNHAFSLESRQLAELTATIYTQTIGHNELIDRTRQKTDPRDLHP